MRSWVVLAEDHLAPAKALRSHAIRELDELGVRKPGEERKSSEVLRDPLLGHLADSTKRT